MKIVILVIKGILMYATLIYWLLLIGAVDSLSVLPTIIAFVVGFALIFACKKFLTIKDVEKLTGNDHKDIES